MGERTPGVVGLNPVTPSDTRLSPGQSPGAGFADQRQIRLDSGGVSTGAGKLTIVGWPRNLSWSEFKEIPARPAGENEDAQIRSEAAPPSQAVVTSEGGALRVVSITIRLRTVREDCWVVKDQKSADLLSHEQGHYDLTGLLARDSGNEILAVRASSRDELQARVSTIVKKYQERAETWTKRYDSETDHSRNRDAQKRWDDQIHDAMKDGTPFSPP
jgi:hypothetical protein